LDILRRAMEEPMRRIAENAGQDGSLIVGTIRREKKNVGYNAATRQTEDLIAAGIIDPAKVVRTALQNAASISGLLLTTDAAITDLPDADGAPPMPGGEMGM
ncbi:MAG: chaperonin GroEL, partial [Acidobacteriota bacterium]